MKVSKYARTRFVCDFLRGYASMLRISIVHAFEYRSRRWWSNVLFFLKWMRAFSSSFEVVFALFLRRKFYKRRGRFCAHLRFAFSLAPSGPRKNCARKKKNGRKRVRFVRWCRFITRVRFARTQTVRWWWFLPVIFFLRERSFRSFFPRDEGALMPFLLLKLTSSSLCLVQINTAQHREPSHWLPKEDWNHGWKQAPRVLRQAHLRRSRSRFVRRRVERLHL